MKNILTIIILLFVAVGCSSNKVELDTANKVSSISNDKELIKINPSINTFSQACPLFVPLVEEGLLSGAIVSSIITYYINNLDLSIIDTLILGCTHYPLLKPAIKTITKGLTLIDSADSVANETNEILKNNNFINDNNNQGQKKFYVTDSPLNFSNVAKRFLGYPIKDFETARIS